ncbi:hypothetical protein KFE25_007260, partial [Diacronema lutheri]
MPPSIQFSEPPPRGRPTARRASSARMRRARPSAWNKFWAVGRPPVGSEGIGPKMPDMPRGVENEGNTRFLNALVQSLAALD